MGIELFVKPAPLPPPAITQQGRFMLKNPELD